MSKSSAVVAEVGDFDKHALKHVKPEVKNPLPTADDVNKEKGEKSLMEEIEKGKLLKKVETVERNHLPTKEEIEIEKKAAQQ